MKFKLVINCDNAAFDYCPVSETARILRKVADEIATAQGQSVCMDYNGNKVGVYLFDSGTYDLDAEMK